MRQTLRPLFRSRAGLGALALASTLFVPLATLAAQQPIPTPSSILGFEPGADRHLPSWKQIVDYFTALDKASPRVSVRTLGKTTLGRPFIVAPYQTEHAGQPRSLPSGPAQAHGSEVAGGR